MIKKIKKFLIAFKKAWQEVDNPVESMDDFQRVDNFSELIEGILREEVVRNDLLRVEKDSMLNHVKMIDAFLTRILKHLLPGYLYDMYIEDKKPIPKLEMKLHRSKDLKQKVMCEEVQIKYYDKPVGHMIITSFREEDKIKTIGKELYAVDDKVIENYEFKKPL